MSASREQAGSSGPTSWKPEVEILLLCARKELTPVRSERLLELLRNGLDYNRLLWLAGYHGLVPLLYWHLNTHASETAPPLFLERLKGYFLENTKNMLEWTVILFEILEDLDKDGVFAVPYKGPALASQLYGNIALRQRGDIDIIVERRDVKSARRILEEAGFRNSQLVSPAGHEFMERKRYSEIFSRDKGPPVELHWKFTRSGFAFPLELKDLRPRLGDHTLVGRMIPVFGTEDLLLILCAHGAKHCWERLEMICAVAEVARQGEVDWPETVARALQLKVEKTLFLGLTLAHDLLDAPIPAPVIEAARSSRDVTRLAALVRKSFLVANHGLEATKPPSRLPRDLFKLRLQRTQRDQLRYVYHRLTTPRRSDTRMMVPFGRRSMPLPALVRPFRVFAKLIRRHLFR